MLGLRLGGKKPREQSSSPWESLQQVAGQVGIGLAAGLYLQPDILDPVLDQPGHSQPSERSNTGVSELVRKTESPDLWSQNLHFNKPPSNSYAHYTVEKSCVESWAR